MSGSVLHIQRVCPQQSRISRVQVQIWSSRGTRDKTRSRRSSLPLWAPMAAVECFFLREAEGCGLGRLGYVGCWVQGLGFEGLGFMVLGIYHLTLKFYTAKP